MKEMRRAPGGRDERGVGTVLVAGICLGLVMVAATAALIVGWLARAGPEQRRPDSPGRCRGGG